MPLRILHVAPYSEHAWGYGGIPRVVASITAQQVAQGHEVTVCATDVVSADARMPRPETARRFAPWPEQREPSGVRLRIFPNVSNHVAYHLQMFTPIGLASFLRRHARAFDVAHLYACHNFPVAIAGRILTEERVPYVLAPHGTAPLIERRQQAKWIFDHLFARRLIDDARLLLAVSDAEKAQLVRLGVADARIAVVPNPVAVADVPAPATRGDFRRRLGLDWDELVVFLGKLTPRKGVDVLLQAFARLQRKSAGLIIAGNDMGTGGELRRLAQRLSLQDRVRFTGLVRGGDRYRLLGDADVLAYPSRDEAFGLVPLEALSCGTPVIVGDDSGCAEVVTRTGGGKLVRFGDSKMLATAMSDILESPLHWRGEARAAGDRVRSSYSAASLCNALDGVYAHALAR
jgi:glycosyltransferase involved in cell wall biosynthesis